MDARRLLPPLLALLAFAGVGELAARRWLVAPFSTTLLMPMSVPSPTVQPCSITLWPMLTLRPSVIG